MGPRGEATANGLQVRRKCQGPSSVSVKKFRITISGRAYEVEVGELTETPVRVTVDGVAYEVEVPPGAVSVPAAPAMPATPPPPRPVQPAQAISPPRAASPVPPAPQPRPPAGPAAQGSDAGTVRAIMPGRVLRVNVAAGAAVSRGQALMVLESMKMEQTIAAPRDGTVKGVHVAAGDAVTRGQTLIELE